MQTPDSIQIHSADALILVDVQNDFLPGGALGVPRGNEVVPVLNRYIELFEQKGLPIVATRDWHPANHSSFKEQGGPWPPHCLRDSKGAEFDAHLHLPPSAKIVSKAMESDREAYSGFQGTDLGEWLKSKGAQRLFIGGLATEYCVLNTVKDALKEDFQVVFLRDAVRAIEAKEGDERKALNEMEQLGARPATLHTIVEAPMATQADGFFHLNPLKTPHTNRNLNQSLLLADMYELAMLEAYYREGMNEIAVFELFSRKLPDHRHFLMAAGLEQALDYLEHATFSADELEWLHKKLNLDADFIEYLRQFRFTGDVYALAEGTVCFPDEPLIRVVAPLPQAQYYETRLLNIIHAQTVFASKAARCRLAADDKLLLDFGFRRAHGSEAGLFAARASYLAGFDGTSTMLASALYDIPCVGTMAHSFIQAHEEETNAFLEFARARPQNLVILIDTYNTEAAAAAVVKLAPELERQHIAIQGVRIDSGNLAEHAKEVRKILDEGGLRDTKIYVSGSIDEFKIRRLLAKGAPVDGFGVGTALDTSQDAPALDCAYKLSEYASIPRRKKSEGKATLPGTKQVYRRYDKAGNMVQDYLTLVNGRLEAKVDEKLTQEPLISKVMENGKRLSAPLSLAEARVRAKDNLSKLPAELKKLQTDFIYPVEISSSIKSLII